MKKLIPGLMLAVLSFGLMGVSSCDDRTTPKGVVETAAIRMSKNELEGVKETLKGEALKQYGNKEGMAALKSKLLTRRGLRVEKATFVKSKPVTDNGFQTAINTYTVELLAKGSTGAKEERVATATVVCDIFSVARGEGLHATTDEYSECWIVELK